VSEEKDRAEALQRAYEHCDALAREHERDRWLAALFAPEEARRHLNALVAFDHEIARIRGAAREPAAGEMRLAWWGEALSGAREAEAAAHPVAAALLDTKARFGLPAQALDNLLQARIFDLYEDPMPTLYDLEAYCGETSSALFQLSTLILADGRDVGAAEASGHAGVAFGLTRVLRAFSGASARGQIFAPREVLERHGVTIEDVRTRRDSAGLRAALSELADEARRRLSEAEARLAGLPKIVFPAFAPLGAVRLDLDRLRRRRSSPFEPFAAPAPWRRQWALWRWAQAR
jgi:15-cis-phytoene synthase